MGSTASQQPASQQPTANSQQPTANSQEAWTVSARRGAEGQRGRGAEGSGGMHSMAMAMAMTMAILRMIDAAAAVAALLLYYERCCPASPPMLRPMRPNATRAERKQVQNVARGLRVSACECECEFLPCAASERASGVSQQRRCTFLVVLPQRPASAIRDPDPVGYTT
jgi:hypothetical protein